MKMGRNEILLLISIMVIVFMTVSLFNFLMIISPIRDHYREALFYLIMGCVCLVCLLIEKRFNFISTEAE